MGENYIRHQEEQIEMVQPVQIPSQFLQFQPMYYGYSLGGAMMGGYSWMGYGEPMCQMMGGGLMQ